MLSCLGRIFLKTSGTEKGILTDVKQGECKNPDRGYKNIGVILELFLFVLYLFCNSVTALSTSYRENCARCQLKKNVIIMF